MSSVHLSPAAWSRSALDEIATGPMPCVRLGGARFAAITERASVAEIVNATSAHRGHWTITANLDHLRRYGRDPLAQQLIDAADLVVADGMPLIWASKLAGTALPERVAGSNLIWSICEQARWRGQSIFLLGGDPGVAERAGDVLCERFPGLRMAGTLCPPRGFEHDDAELERLGRSVVAAGPDIVFVALGFPKQDLLIRRLRYELPSVSFIGVGISLSFVAGDISRAPVWMRRIGFEWFYRLLQEPRRLARRYLFSGVPFVCRLLVSALLHRLRGANVVQARRDDWGWDLTPSGWDTANLNGEHRGSDAPAGPCDDGEQGVVQRMSAESARVRASGARDAGRRSTTPASR